MLTFNMTNGDKMFISDDNKTIVSPNLHKEIKDKLKETDNGTKPEIDIEKIEDKSEE